MTQRAFNAAAYPFVYLLAALVSGILLQQQLPSFPGICWLCLTLCLFILSWILHRIAAIKSLLSKARNTALLLTFGFLGTAIGFYGNIQNTTLWYGHYLQQTTALKIQLTEAPVNKAKTVLLNATVQATLQNGQWLHATGDLKVYVYKKGLSDTFKAGQILLIPNKLSVLRTSGNPFAFDPAIYANRNGLYHQCFLSTKSIVVYKADAVSQSFVYALRQSIQQAIHKNIKDSTTMGLVDAMLLNDRISLDAGLQQAYTTTGIIHILAISGMHVILLAGIILWLLGKILFVKMEKGKYIIALILVWIYIAITGFPPSANRSAVMFSIYTIGILLERDGHPLNTWAASGFILICYNPYWIYDVGFQLSFLAVLSILLFNKTITHWWQPKNYFLRKSWEIVAISIAVQVLVFPLVIYYFHQFPLLVFLANIPAGLYSTILMIGAIIIFIVNSTGLSCLWVGQLLSILTKAFNAFIVLLSRYSPESFRQLFLDATGYWLSMFVIIAVSVFLYYKNVKQLFAGLGFAILLMLYFIKEEIAVLHQERIIVYQLSNESQVDVIKGKQMIHHYTVSNQQYKYAVSPARIGFGIHTSTIDSSRSLFRIHNKNILLLEDGFRGNSPSFPVDVLIVSNKCDFEPEQWFQIFHPKKIILDGSLPRWKAAQWKANLQEAGAQVHWVAEDGAWVYPAL
jgi:competence protein ComEC